MKLTPLKTETRLVVFAKLPEPGRVKTRLGAEVGLETAANFYRAWTPPFVDRLFELGTSVSIEFCLDPGEGDRDEVLRLSREWIPRNVDRTFQEGEGLGARLKNAFERNFAEDWKEVYCYGSDSPHLTLEEIRENIRLIRENDVVLGPAEDGGYYTIGFRRPPGDLFDSVRWSCEETMADTVRAAEAKGWSVGYGPMSYDIDTRKDLDRLIGEGIAEWGFLADILSG